MKVKTITPQVTLLQGAKYTPSATTDITETWRRFGWVPLNEVNNQATKAVGKAMERSHASS
jgi:hypothetical protein